MDAEKRRKGGWTFTKRLIGMPDALAVIRSIQAADEAVCFVPDIRYVHNFGMFRRKTGTL